MHVTRVQTSPVCLLLPVRLSGCLHYSITKRGFRLIFWLCPRGRYIIQQQPNLLVGLNFVLSVRSPDRDPEQPRALAWRRRLAVAVFPF